MTTRADRIFRTILRAALIVFVAISLLPLDVQAAPAKKQPAGEGKIPLVLILPFQIHAAPEHSQLGNEIPASLADRLAAKGVRTIPIDRMFTILEEQKIQSLDTATAKRLAQSVGATHAVYGSINHMGETLSIDARLIPTGGGQGKPYFIEAPGGVSGIVPATEDLATRIGGEFVRKGNIAGVEVRGTKVLDPEVVLMRINTKRGDALDSATIDAEIKRIWELGYFSDVRVDVEHRPGGPVVVYTVTEKPRIEEITVEGAKELDEEDILAAMSSRTGSILNDKLLAEDIQKILELYRKSGFFRAEVSQKVNLRQDGSTAEVVLTINEGKKLYVKEIKLEGVEQLSESDVKGQMLLSERGIISWITGSGVLKEELIERDSAAISSYYLDRGFLDSVVGAAKIDYEEDGIVVTFPINEGARYKLGKIIFEGDLIDSDERLRSLSKMDELAKDDDYFNLSVMQADARKITEFYSDYGYAFCEVSPNPLKVEGGEPVVDIIYAIEKNNKVHVRRVMVEGNIKTRDNVILREMRLGDGEQFSGSKLRRSSERLNKLGYFEVAETELVPTSSEEEVDLKIKVKERPTGAIMAGVGYSTFSSVGVSGTIMESNLWGKGYRTSLQAAFSGRRNAYTFAFTNPRLNDTNLSVGTDLYFWRDDYIDYRKKTIGGVVRFGYPLGEYTGLGWGYRLDQYKLYDMDDDASELIRHYADETRYSSVALAKITRDTTNKLHPTDGTINSIAAEYGGGILAGDDDFVSLGVEHQTYYELATDHVLHGRVKGSAIFKNGSDEIPVFERFWMGGIDSVRGYNSRDIVPRDKHTGDRIGGTRMAFANLEYIWYASNELGIALVPFFDIGFNIDTDRNYTWSDEVKKSFGTEVRWRSPMGDMRLSYGIPLDETRKGDRPGGRFEFTMGQTF